MYNKFRGFILTEHPTYKYFIPTCIHTLNVLKLLKKDINIFFKFNVKGIL